MLENVQFNANTAVETGGGLFIKSTTHTKLKKSFFRENKASSGGGLAVVNDGYGKSVSEVSATSAKQSTITIEDTDFVGNIAQDGLGVVSKSIANRFDGGAIFVYSSIFVASRSQLFNNKADRYGGGIFAESSEVELSNIVIEGNKNVKAKGGGGGGIGCLSSTMKLTAMTVQSNAANGDGGGGWFTFCSPHIKESVWSSNTAKSRGAGLFFGMMSHPMFLRSANPGQKAIIANNTANEGAGGIGCYRCAGMDISMVTFENNLVTHGVGGCMVVENTQSSNIKSSSFKQCTAFAGGGAIYSYSSSNIDIRDSEFIGNSATEGGGGGILWGFTSAEMAVMTPSKVPISLDANLIEQNNSALYGNFIASTAHSKFMMDGPIDPNDENAGDLFLRASGSRVRLDSRASEWGILAGGKPFCKNCTDTASPPQRYLQVAIIDWYNHIVASSTGLVKLNIISTPPGATLSGVTEVPADRGIAVFKEFVVIAAPQTSLTITFSSRESKKVRGPVVKAYIRNCEKGEFYNERSLSKECTSCPQGRYSNQVGNQTQCKTCAPGTYHSESFARGCQDCDCAVIMCKQGEEYHPETRECKSCPSGKYGEKCSTLKCPCINCPAFADTLGLLRRTSSDDCRCADGYYPLVKKGKNGKMLRCAECPVGATCLRQNATNEAKRWVKPQEGYWQTPDDWKLPMERSFAKCPSNCLPTGCKNGTDGVLCQVCAKGYGKRLGTCAPCDSSSLFFYALGIVVVIFILALAMLFVRRKIKQNRHYLGAWKAFMGVMQVQFDFVQVNTAMPSVLAIDFPENFLNFSNIFELVNVDFVTFTGATCVEGVNFFTKFGIMSLLPLCALLFGMYIYLRGRYQKIPMDEEAVKMASHEMFIMVDENHNGLVEVDEYKRLMSVVDAAKVEKSLNSKEFEDRLLTLDRQPLLKWWHNEQTVEHALAFSVQLFLFVHTPVTRKVFEYYNCRNVRGRHFLKVDYSIECFSPEWDWFQSYVLFVGLLFTLGLPVVLAFYLYRHRKELYTGYVQARLGVVYSTFNKGAEGWEIHEIVRKTLLTGVIISLHQRPTIQASTAVLICALSIGSINFFRPYKTREVFWLTQLAYLVTLLKFISATVLITSAAKAEQKSIGILLITLDVLFFVSSFLGFFGSWYMLYKRIKKLDAEKTEHENRLNAAKHSALHASASFARGACSGNKAGNTKIVPISIPASTNLEEHEAPHVTLLKLVRNVYGAGSPEYAIVVKTVGQTDGVTAVLPTKEEKEAVMKVVSGLPPEHRTEATSLVGVAGL